MFNLRSLWSRRPGTARRPAAAYPAAYRFRPQVEGFEDRTVPSAPGNLGPAIHGQAAPAAAANLLNITNVSLSNFQIVDNVLHATGTVKGTLAGLPFTTNITDFALQLLPDDPATPATECSVLHLQLDPIHLNLLGLHADTSPICLDITATEGGGILGNLLCSLAGGDGGLGGPLLPTAGQLTDLVGGLVDILIGALAGLAPGQPSGDTVCTGECEVLDLVLGPVNLSLLGLNVSLDDCNGGPVEVCLSATAGEGLLGNLLCGLSGFPNLNLDLQDITQIVNQATDALADGVLSGREIGQLTSLVNHLKR